MATNICKRCLLKDMQDENDYFKSVQKYRASLNNKQKTNDEEYERRLQCCKNCEDLINGVCSQCGCYVEMRAAVISMHCAKNENIW